MTAPTVQQINPDRLDLARAVEIAPGWLVGLNISNRNKTADIRAFRAIYGPTTPEQLAIELPNA